MAADKNKPGESNKNLIEVQFLIINVLTSFFSQQVIYLDEIDSSDCGPA